MPEILIEEPAAEPLTLAEAKAFLRIEHAADDDLIGALVKAARCAIEAASRRALITQGFRIALDGWPASGRIVSPVSPLRAVTTARIRAAGGAPSELNLSAFTLDTGTDASGIANFRLGVDYKAFDINVFVNNAFDRDKGARGGGRSNCLDADCNAFQGYNPNRTRNTGYPREIGLQIAYRH